MRVLAINCGSSTLKFQVFELGREDKGYGRERRLALGLVEEIGTRGAIDFTIENGSFPREMSAVNPEGAVVRYHGAQGSPTF
jgi:acetate kinase